MVHYGTPKGFYANSQGRNYTALLWISPAPTPSDDEGLPQQQLQQLEPQAEAQGPVEAEARHQKSRMKRHLSQHRARCRMEDKLPIPAVPFSYACSSGQAGGAFCQRVVEAKRVVSTVLNFGVSSIY